MKQWNMLMNLIKWILILKLKKSRTGAYSPTIYKNSDGSTVLCNLYNSVYQGGLPICYAYVHVKFRSFGYMLWI